MSRLLSSFLLVAALGSAASPAEPAASPRRLAVELAERLKTGLLVKDPRDVAFCEAVARSVNEGRMPAKVVDSTYLWAVQRGRRYPFPAFKEALRIKAAKLGVTL